VPLQACLVERTRGEEIKAAIMIRILIFFFPVLKIIISQFKNFKNNKNLCHISIRQTQKKSN